MFGTRCWTFKLNFQIIGEAVNRLRKHDPTFAARISEADQIVAFRNRLIHGYDVIDFPTVWRTIHVFLPELLSTVDAMLRDADNDLETHG